MKTMCRAYIDIETTGLSPRYHEITVVGVCVERGRSRTLVQLYDETLTAERLADVLSPAEILYSYNGRRFDLPFIKAALGADLVGEFEHCDLMHHCWRRNLWGGLKAVERQLNIARRTKDVDGYMAVLLWQDYKDNGNTRALRKLLKYNAEDVTNLATLRLKLGA